MGSKKSRAEQPVVVEGRSPSATRRYEGAAPPARGAGEAAAVGGAQGAQGLHRVRGARRGRQGGTIKAITERVSPGSFASSRCPPTEREKSQLYFQRYIPTCRRRARSSSSIAAGTTGPAWSASWALQRGGERQIPGRHPMVEKAMVDSGIILLKYWLEVTPEEQERRLRDRIDDGRKIWKLSPWTSSPSTAGMTTPGRGMPCSSPPTPPGPPGSWPARGQEAGAPQHHLPPAVAHPLRGAAGRAGQAAQAQDRQGRPSEHPCASFRSASRQAG